MASTGLPSSVKLWPIVTFFSYQRCEEEEDDDHHDDDDKNDEEEEEEEEDDQEGVCISTKCERA